MSSMPGYLHAYSFLSSVAFWIALSLPMLLTSLMFVGSAFQWKRRFEGPRATDTHKFHGDALRQSMSAGITTAGLALTLVAGLLTYVTTTLHASLDSAAVLLASMIVLAISIVVGVFNLYSMAPETDENGLISITKSRLT